MNSFRDDLALALDLADMADAITLPRFRAADLRVTRKPDRSPVTDADMAAEQALRAAIGGRRPADAILGEEEGGALGAGRGWVLDPIDGTKNFSRGMPVWATLIALTEAGRPVVGVVSAPALGRRWWAARGAGAYAGRSLTSATPCRVSLVTRLADASFSFSSLAGWEKQARLDGLLDLIRATWRTRAYGDFWSYVLVAEGAVDIAAEPEVSLWDLAPLSLIVEEAGGRFTSVDGVPGPSHGSAVATNGPLHEEVLQLLAGSE